MNESFSFIQLPWAHWMNERGPVAGRMVAII